MLFTRTSQSPICRAVPIVIAVSRLIPGPEAFATGVAVLVAEGSVGSAAGSAVGVAEGVVAGAVGSGAAVASSILSAFTNARKSAIGESSPGRVESVATVRQLPDTNGT